MAKAEIGWTKEFPSRVGYYWFTSSETSLDRDDACVCEVSGSPPNDQVVYVSGEEFTKAGFLKEFPDGEFFGPVSPADAEQLHELRRITQTSLNLLSDLYNSQIGQCLNLPQLMVVEAHMEQLRAVLNPKPEKETQGKLNNLQ